MLALFAATTLCSAFLLFWIEPLFAKMVLPMLGGSPAVWNTCLMFFQTMLLAGYLYAHVTSRYLTSRRQAVIHVALLALAVVSLPVGIPGGWAPPESGNVIPWLTVLLGIAVGAPFVLLAATAPLVQRWLTDSGHPAASNPYILYAASNAGSLVGLLGFPILMEPHLRLSEQTNIWSIAYGFAIVLAAACAVSVWRQNKQPSIPAANSQETDDGGAPTFRDRLKWIALAFVPSSLLLGVTTYLSTDVAAMPLLWVVPLALYLITFIIVFARGARTTSKVILIVHGILVTTLAIVLFWGSGTTLRTSYALHLAVFATTALVLHGELAASRPSPAHLTEFYLWMALGGALGGAFNAIVAPQIFKSIAEYQWVLAASVFLRPSWRWRANDVIERIPMFTLSLIPAMIIGYVSFYNYADHRIIGISAKLLASVVAGLILVFVSGSALRFGVGIALLLVAHEVPGFRAARNMYADRSFFGAYRVQAVFGPAHRLVHGTTTHGAQYQDAARRLIPETYYHPAGPVGQLFAALDSRLAGKGVAVVGLGAGTVLCYSKPGENWTFFEIDPLVKRISSNPKYFSYLTECSVRPRIVIGDARLSLAKEPTARFSVLILDAFSSDAIPVHLLTREAFALYERVLDEHGVLFVHISNKHLDLKPVVASLAKDAGLVALMQDHEPDEKVDGAFAYASEWVALARTSADLGSLATDSRWEAVPSRVGYQVWTDDYSNVFNVIRW